LVEAFLAVSPGGNVAALAEVLDLDVELRSRGGPDGLPVPAQANGAEQVARLILARGSRFAPFGRPAFANVRPGAIVVIEGQLLSVVPFEAIDERWRGSSWR
jgi:hypothetical protein